MAISTNFKHEIALPKLTITCSLCTQKPPTGKAEGSFLVKIKVFGVQTISYQMAIVLRRVLFRTGTAKTCTIIGTARIDSNTVSRIDETLAVDRRATALHTIA